MFRRRSPYGERGLKYRTPDRGMAVMSRSPYGERGLKFRQAAGEGSHRESLSLRRAWIEISRFEQQTNSAVVALLTESVD